MFVSLTSKLRFQPLKSGIGKYFVQIFFLKVNENFQNIFVSINQTWWYFFLVCISGRLSVWPLREKDSFFVLEMLILGLSQSLMFANFNFQLIHCKLFQGCLFGHTCYNLIIPQHLVFKIIIMVGSEVLDQYSNERLLSLCSHFPLHFT